jgi:hypothetical protein
LEGGWDQHGAVCLRHWRRPWATTSESTLLASRLRGGFGHAACTHARAQRLGAILFSSRLAP